MTIGIVGAGNIGATLVEKLAAKGHPISLANSKVPGSLHELAQETSAQTLRKDEVVKNVEAIILSAPFIGFKDMSGLLLFGFGRGLRDRHLQLLSLSRRRHRVGGWHTRKRVGQQADQSTGGRRSVLVIVE